VPALRGRAPVRKTGSSLLLPHTINNQFGPTTTQFTGQPFITQYDELCVPSTLP